MKHLLLLSMLLISSSAVANLDQTQYPSNMKCDFVHSSGGKRIREATRSTEDQPAHVIHEPIGKDHVLAIRLDGYDYPQMNSVKVFKGTANVVFSAETDTHNMCDTQELYGQVQIESIDVSYRCKVICSLRD